MLFFFCFGLSLQKRNMRKFTTKSEIKNADLTYYENEDGKKLRLKPKNQKDIVHFLVKINEMSLANVAENLGKSQPSLFKTLQRENLSYSEFLTIYNMVTSEHFETGVDFIDDLNGLYKLQLKQVVELLEAEEKPFIVKCGSYVCKLILKK